MINSIHKKRSSLPYRILCSFIALTFLTNVILPPTPVSAQTILNLPVPGTMVASSAGFMPLRLIGVTVHPENPLEFDFIVNSGDTDLSPEAYKEESRKLIKYFLASLTVPEDELWVNLSPYEKDRMVPEGLGQTEMGRDMLAQDYLLKQLTASLMYPEKELGKKFWERIYKEAREKYGTTEIPVNTFNKVWIVPQEAVVYEKDTSAYVVKSRLKVMLEEDYEASHYSRSDAESRAPREGSAGARDEAHGQLKSLVSGNQTKETRDDFNSPDVTQVIREVLIPAIEVEINEGENFANLRQMYHSLILAAWYKLKLKDGLLGKVYIDQNKTKGIDTEDKQVNQKIYDQYIESFKKGVYNYIKEDTDSATQDVIPRKYFSGGLNFGLGKAIGAVILSALLLSATMTKSAQAQVVQEINGNGRNSAVTVLLNEDTQESARPILAAFEPPISIGQERTTSGESASSPIEEAVDSLVKTLRPRLDQFQQELDQLDSDFSSERLNRLSDIARQMASVLSAFGASRFNEEAADLIHDMVAKLLMGINGMVWQLKVKKEKNEVSAIRRDFEEKYQEHFRNLELIVARGELRNIESYWDQRSFRFINLDKLPPASAQTPRGTSSSPVVALIADKLNQGENFGFFIHLDRLLNISETVERAAFHSLEGFLAYKMIGQEGWPNDFKDAKQKAEKVVHNKKMELLEANQGHEPRDVRDALGVAMTDEQLYSRVEDYIPKDPKLFEALSTLKNRYPNSRLIAMMGAQTKEMAARVLKHLGVLEFVTIYTYKGSGEGMTAEALFRAREALNLPAENAVFVSSFPRRDIGGDGEIMLALPAKNMETVYALASALSWSIDFEEELAAITEIKMIKLRRDGIKRLRDRFSHAESLEKSIQKIDGKNALVWWDEGPAYVLYFDTGSPYGIDKQLMSEMVEEVREAEPVRHMLDYDMFDDGAYVRAEAIRYATWGLHWGWNTVAGLKRLAAQVVEILDRKMEETEKYLSRKEQALQKKYATAQTLSDSASARNPGGETSSSPVEGNEVNKPMGPMEDYERIIRGYAADPDPYAKTGPIAEMVKRGVTFEEAKVWYAVKQESNVGFPKGFWQHPRTARNMLLVALDTAIPGFKEFWDQGKIKEMAAGYRAKVLKYPGGQVAFFKKAGLGPLIYGGSIEKMNSPGSVLQLHLPGLISDNNPDALKSLEVGKKASASSPIVQGKEVAIKGPSLAQFSNLPVVLPLQQVTMAVKFLSVKDTEFQPAEAQEFKAKWPAHKAFERYAPDKEDQENWPYIVFGDYKVSFNNIGKNDNYNKPIRIRSAGAEVNFELNDILKGLIPEEFLREMTISGAAFNPVNRNLAFLLQHTYFDKGFDIPNYEYFNQYAIIELDWRNARVKVVVHQGKDLKNGRASRDFDIDSKGNYIVLEEPHFQRPVIRIFNQKGVLIGEQEVKDDFRAGGIAVQGDTIFLKHDEIYRREPSTLREVEIKYPQGVEEPAPTKRLPAPRVAQGKKTPASSRAPGGGAFYPEPLDSARDGSKGVVSKVEPQGPTEGGPGRRASSPVSTRKWLVAYEDWFSSAPINGRLSELGKAAKLSAAPIMFTLCVSCGLSGPGYADRTFIPVEDQPPVVVADPLAGLNELERTPLESAPTLRTATLEALMNDVTTEIIDTIGSRLPWRQMGMESNFQTAAYLRNNLSGYSNFLVSAVKLADKPSLFYRRISALEGPAYIAALLPGTLGAQARNIILTAHFDAFKDGSDDNASGVAALMALAKAVPNYSFSDNVFIVFTNENRWGQIGAHILAKDLLDMGADQNNTIVVNIDAIGQSYQQGGVPKIWASFPVREGQPAELPTALGPFDLAELLQDAPFEVHKDINVVSLPRFMSDADVLSIYGNFPSITISGISYSDLQSRGLDPKLDDTIGKVDKSAVREIGHWLFTVLGKMAGREGAPGRQDSTKYRSVESLQTQTIFSEDYSPITGELFASYGLSFATRHRILKEEHEDLDRWFAFIRERVPAYHDYLKGFNYDLSNGVASVEEETKILTFGFPLGSKAIKAQGYSSQYGTSYVSRSFILTHEFSHLLALDFRKRLGLDAQNGIIGIGLHEASEEELFINDVAAMMLYGEEGWADYVSLFDIFIDLQFVQLSEFQQEERRVPVNVAQFSEVRLNRVKEMAGMLGISLEGGYADSVSLRPYLPELSFDPLAFLNEAQAPASAQALDGRASSSPVEENRGEVLGLSAQKEIIRAQFDVAKKSLGINEDILLTDAAIRSFLSDKAMDTDRYKDLVLQAVVAKLAQVELMRKHQVLPTQAQQDMVNAIQRLVQGRLNRAGMTLQNVPVVFVPSKILKSGLEIFGEFRDIPAFYTPIWPHIFISADEEIPNMDHFLIHEMLHANSKGFLEPLLNEGATEYFTVKMQLYRDGRDKVLIQDVIDYVKTKNEQKDLKSDYVWELMVILNLIIKLGKEEGPILDAYFKGDYTSLASLKEWPGVLQLAHQYRKARDSETKEGWYKKTEKLLGVVAASSPLEDIDLQRASSRAPGGEASSSPVVNENSRENVSRRITNIIFTVLNYLDRNDFMISLRFKEDLEATSNDLIEIAARVEDEFDITLPPDAVETFKTEEDYLNYIMEEIAWADSVRSFPDDKGGPASSQVPGGGASSSPVIEEVKAFLTGIPIDGFHVYDAEYNVEPVSLTAWIEDNQLFVKDIANDDLAAMMSIGDIENPIEMLILFKAMLGAWREISPGDYYQLAPQTIKLIDQKVVELAKTSVAVPDRDKKFLETFLLSATWVHSQQGAHSKFAPDKEPVKLAVWFDGKKWIVKDVPGATKEITTIEADTLNPIEMLVRLKEAIQNTQNLNPENYYVLTPATIGVIDREIVELSSIPFLKVAVEAVTTMNQGEDIQSLKALGIRTVILKDENVTEELIDRLLQEGIKPVVSYWAFRILPSQYQEKVLSYLEPSTYAEMVEVRAKGSVMGRLLESIPKLNTDAIDMIFMSVLIMNSEIRDQGTLPARENYALRTSSLTEQQAATLKQRITELTRRQSLRYFKKIIVDVPRETLPQIQQVLSASAPAPGGGASSSPVGIPEDAKINFQSSSLNEEDQKMVGELFRETNLVAKTLEYCCQEAAFSAPDIDLMNVRLHSAAGKNRITYKVDVFSHKNNQFLTAAFALKISRTKDRDALHQTILARITSEKLGGRPSFIAKLSDGRYVTAGTFYDQDTLNEVDLRRNDIDLFYVAAVKTSINIWKDLGGFFPLDPHDRQYIVAKYPVSQGDLPEMLLVDRGNFRLQGKTIDFAENINSDGELEITAKGINLSDLSQWVEPTSETKLIENLIYDLSQPVSTRHIGTSDPDDEMLKAVNDLRRPQLSEEVIINGVEQALGVEGSVRFWKNFLADPKKNSIASIRQLEEKIIKRFPELASSPVAESRQTSDVSLQTGLRTDDGRPTTNPGGIDLNPALLDLQIKRDGNGVPLPLPLQPIETMHIDGFVPIIINITPIPNLPMLLGLADTTPDTQQTKPDLKAREIESVSLN